MLVGVFFYQGAMKGRMPNLPGKIGGDMGGLGGLGGMLPPGVVRSSRSDILMHWIPACLK